MHNWIRYSKAMRLVRIVLFGYHLAIQFPVMGRPQFFSRYNDGYSAFVDIGPLRLYRHRYLEKSHPIRQK